MTIEARHALSLACFMARRRAFRDGAFVITLAGGLSSCAFAAETLDDNVETEQQAYTVTGFSWNQEINGVNMGEATNRYFCALTGMSGRFMGDGEEVRVVRAPMKNNPGRYVWLLHGSSQQTGVDASAHCITTRDGYTGEKVWSQGETAKDLGPMNDRVCFLTRIRGHFAGAGEQVRIRSENDRWVLDGTSQQSGVLAGARCVYAMPSYIIENEAWFYFANAQLGFESIGFKSMGGADDDYCALTHVQGAFSNGDQSVSIISYGELGWHLRTYGWAVGPLGVGARCLLHQPPIR
jgi:hypothetical protein